MTKATQFAKKRPAKKRDLSDAEDGDEFDADFEALIRARLEAHCDQLLTDSENDDSVKYAESRNDAPHATENAIHGPANREKKRRKVEPAPLKAPAPPAKALQTDALPSSAESWASFLDTPTVAPAVSAGKTAQTAGPGRVSVVDATKYSSNPVVRAAVQDKKRFMSADALKVHSDGNNSAAAGGRRRPKQPKETFREQLAREVEELGASTLTGRAKKEHDIKKILQLGGKAPKNLKTPIKILKGMKKKEGEREQKKKEEAIQTGMHIKKKARRKPLDKKSKGLDLTGHAGKFSGGMLRVKPSLIARVSKGKK